MQRASFVSKRFPAPRWALELRQHLSVDKLRVLIGKVLNDSGKAAWRKKLFALLSNDPVAEVPEPRSVDGDPVLRRSSKLDHPCSSEVVQARISDRCVDCERGLWSTRA